MTLQKTDAATVQLTAPMRSIDLAPGCVQPQAFLGLTFNWGGLLGYVAATGHLNWQICLPLYASGVCWTLVYDTIYAHQDKSDDVAAGVKSTALLFASHNRLIMSAFAIGHLGLLAAAGEPYRPCLTDQPDKMIAI